MHRQEIVQMKLAKNDLKCMGIYFLMTCMYYLLLFQKAISIIWGLKIIVLNLV